MKKRTILFATVLLGLSCSVLMSGQESTTAVSNGIKGSEPGLVGLSGVPSAAQPAVSASLGRELRDYYAEAQDGHIRMKNSRHTLIADFGSDGVQMRTGNSDWGIKLRGYGYDASIKEVGKAKPQATFNRIEYRHGMLTEWYVNGPFGLEQGFTLSTPPGQVVGRNYKASETASNAIGSN